MNHIMEFEKCLRFFRLKGIF